MFEFYCVKKNKKNQNLQFLRMILSCAMTLTSEI